MNAHQRLINGIFVMLALTSNIQAQTHSHAASYAGQQQRSIKALSAQEQQDWLEGKGQGLAKAAELNGFPGPMHTLENADALKLSIAQREATQSLMHRHKSAVRTLGQQLVEQEKLLDDLFSKGQVTPEKVSAYTSTIAALQGQIRAEHLRTHIEQRAILSDSQVAQYNAVRGYAN